MKVKCKNGFYDNRHLEPKKPLKQEMYDFEKMGYCPSCSFNNGTIFQLVFQHNNYCPNCGQELDWD